MIHIKEHAYKQNFTTEQHKMEKHTPCY
ncbi:protein of unknown function [Rhodovastum atsumiense]|nr:protein of unknown function [Rhodovastum atsumiense]